MCYFNRIVRAGDLRVLSKYKAISALLRPSLSSTFQPSSKMRFSGGHSQPIKAKELRVLTSYGALEASLKKS